MDENKKLLFEYKECIGEKTNNQAEYLALIKALELATAYCRRNVKCFLDSQLIVKQLNGSYRIKNKILRDYFYQVKERENAFYEVSYNHRSRDNKYIIMADELLNKALDDVL